ncbi:MAG: plastocyanin/azurin family copper-binding protein [Candidatus Hodarchaeales archaeon]|jgi:hypothetical protein
MTKLVSFLTLLLFLGITFNSFPLEVRSSPVADEMVTITAGTNNQLQYDKTELNFQRNVWVNLTLKVVSSMSHNLVIESFAAEGFEGTSQTATINSNGGPNGDGIVSIRFKTPDKDVTVAFYCSVGSHRALGMEGNLIVSGGGSTPPPPPTSSAPPISSTPISNPGNPGTGINTSTSSSSTNMAEGTPSDSSSSASAPGYQLAMVLAAFTGLAIVFLRLRRS